MRSKVTDNFDLNSSFAKMNVLLGLLLRCTLFSLSIAFIFIDPQFTPFDQSEVIYFSYPHNQYFSSMVTLYLLVISVPLICILTVSVWKHDPWSVLADFVFSLTGALSLVCFLVSFLQVVTARKTPDFVSRCWPDGVEELTHCAGDANTVVQGLRSFPSGLASWSVCNLFWTSLYISEKLSLFSFPRKSEFWKLCIFVFINYCSVLISLIPFNLNQNFGVDILTGGLIGLITAGAFYFLHFPSLLQNLTQMPRSQRANSEILPISI